ncbi:MAG: ribonuclease Z [Nitrososphaerales archaeon]
MVQLKVVFLGTSSSVPTKKRGLSSIAIKRGAEILLFDAGECVQRAMINAGLGLNRPMKIFITHLHGDHCVGLLGLLQSMSMMRRDKPLTIYGPKGLQSFIKSNIKALGFELTFNLQINTVKQKLVVEEQEYTIYACKAEHPPLTYAYLLVEKPRPGVFYPEAAKSLGIPEGRLWHLLQKGEAITLQGRTITPDQVTGPKRRGRKIGYSGDTRPSKKLIKFFKGCDLLIFDSTYADRHADKAEENQHSTAREAATIAKEAGVKTLVLTHFSARYDDTAELVKEASEVHSNVVAAEDLMELDVKYPE